MLPDQRLVGRIRIYLGTSREMLTSSWGDTKKEQEIIIGKRLMYFGEKVASETKKYTIK